MIILNPTDSSPLYEQITQKIKDLIIGGFLKENDKIPSVRELAATLAINPNTIQKAYKQLEAEGYIFAKTAKGYFVKVPETNNARICALSRQLSEIAHELYFLGCPYEEILKTIDNFYKK